MPVKSTFASNVVVTVNLVGRMRMSREYARGYQPFITASLSKEIEKKGVCVSRVEKFISVCEKSIFLMIYDSFQFLSNSSKNVSNVLIRLYARHPI